MFRPDRSYGNLSAMDTPLSMDDLDRDLFRSWLRQALATTPVGANDSRRAARLTALAERSGYDESQVRKLWAGNRGASPQTVYALGEVLAAGTQAPCFSGLVAWAVVPHYYVHALRLIALTLADGPTPALKSLWPGFTVVLSGSTILGLSGVFHPNPCTTNYDYGIEPSQRPQLQRRRIAEYNYAQFTTSHILPSEPESIRTQDLVDSTNAEEYRSLAKLHHPLIEKAYQQLINEPTFAAHLPHLPRVLRDAIVAETSDLSLDGKCVFRKNLRDWARQLGAEHDWRRFGAWMLPKSTLANIVHPSWGAFYETEYDSFRHPCGCDSTQHASDDDDGTLPPPISGGAAARELLARPSIRI